MTTAIQHTGYHVVWQRPRAACHLIGDPDCLLIKRWTIKLPLTAFKLRVHRMYPLTADRDPHDHPWHFITLVVRGSYDDVRRDGKVTRMQPGTLRFRSSMHTHQTFAGPAGAWTVVLCWPVSRRWGFWRDGTWWDHTPYKQKFGSGMTCE